jgi:hypothetical protein
MALAEAGRLNVTLAPRTRAGSGASNSGSIHTLPVNQSVGPSCRAVALAEADAKGCDPHLLISIGYGLSNLITYNRSCGLL